MIQEIISASMTCTSDLNKWYRKRFKIDKFEWEEKEREGIIKVKVILSKG